MASLAGMLQERGFRVTGSDAAAYPPMSTFLETLDIPVAQPFAEANLDSRPNLVVVGNALSRGNVELERVLDERIPFCSLPQILHDEFLVGKDVLVVAGTHGKTTTTSMLAWIFETAGLQPSFLIGGIAENFGRSFGLGEGKHFIFGRRRIRYGFLRQGAEIPALFSGFRDSYFRGVRPCGYLQGPGRGENSLQAAGESGSASREDCRLRFARESRR